MHSEYMRIIINFLTCSLRFWWCRSVPKAGIVCRSKTVAVCHLDFSLSYRHLNITLFLYMDQGESMFRIWKKERSKKNWGYWVGNIIWNLVLIFAFCFHELQTENLLSVEEVWFSKTIPITKGGFFCQSLPPSLSLAATLESFPTKKNFALWNLSALQSRYSKKCKWLLERKMYKSTLIPFYWKEWNM